MMAGFGHRCITPQQPCRLAGYNRIRKSKGVHDDLYVRVAALGDKKEPLLLVQLDVLNVDNLYLDALYNRLLPLGIEKGNILVFCAHTHSAFGGILNTSTGDNAILTDMLGHTDKLLIDIMTEKTVEAAQTAISDMQPTKLRIAEGSIQGVATNRHSPDMPSDNSLFAMEFHQQNGSKSLLYNLSCHPTVLNADNLMLSADIPGAVNQLLQKRYQTIIFANGAAGDMSTRFTRRESSFDEVERMGRIIVDALDSLWNNQGYDELRFAKLSYTDIYLDEAEVDSIQQATEKLERAQKEYIAAKENGLHHTDIRLAKALVEGAEMNLIKAKANNGKAPGKIKVKTGYLQVNDTGFICVPLELYSVLALQLKERRKIQVIGYANDMLGYLANAQSYDDGDYEALSSRFAKGQGEAYIEQVDKVKPLPAAETAGHLA